LSISEERDKPAYSGGEGPGGSPREREVSVKNAAEEADRLLTPAEVAAMFRVDPKTVTRWAKAGKLSSIRTLGGHRRYRESEIKGLLQDSTTGKA
jgi:excisionase family DNA binding protein